MYRSIYVYVYVYIRTRSAPQYTRLSSRVLLTPASRAAPRALQLAKYCALYSGLRRRQRSRSGCSPRSTSRPTSFPMSSGQPSRLVADGTTSYANKLGRHGPLPHCVERLPGRPLVLLARQEPGHGPRRGLRGGRGGAGCGRGQGGG